MQLQSVTQNALENRRFSYKLLTVWVEWCVHFWWSAVSYQLMHQ